MVIMMKYRFDKQRLVYKRNGKIARFWTTKGARKAVVKAAKEYYVSFFGTVVIESELWRFKNRLPVLVVEGSTYKGEHILNNDGSLNVDSLIKMKHDYNIDWKE